MPVRDDIGFNRAEFDAALRKLDVLPDKLNKRAITGAAATALRPARKESSSKVRKYGKGTWDGYSKARYIARTIKVIRSSSKYPPGAILKIDPKAKDMPVSTYDNREWTAAGYAKVIAIGSQGKNRKQRSTGRNTGKVEGIGNYILDAVRNHYSAMASYFANATIKEMDKAKKKLGF